MRNWTELLPALRRGEARAVGRAITLIENYAPGAAELLQALEEGPEPSTLILGITGPPGCGKSTLTNQLISMFRQEGHRVGIVAVDPSSPKTNGSILGDRIRMMQHATDPEVLVRSMASRNRLGGLSSAAGAAVRVLAHAGCARVVVETVGVGQTEMDVAGLADVTCLVLAPGMGDDIQAMKAGTLEIADVFVVNKLDRPGADELLAEMEHLGRERQVPVCGTNAVTGQGMDALVRVFRDVDALRREAGQREARRRRNQEREVLDWALDLFRPVLLKRIQKMNDLKGDRRSIAQRLIDELSREC